MMRIPLYMPIRTVLVALLLVLAGATNAQQGPVQATIDTNRILIGEQIVLELTAKVTIEDSIIWPSFGDTLTQHIEVVEQTEVAATFDKNDITLKSISQQLVITSFDSGYFALPPIQVVINEHAYETEPFLIEVYSVPVDTTQDIATIKAPYEVNMTLIDWLKQNWKWLLGIYALLVAISFVIYYLEKNNKKSREKVVIKMPTKPAHEIALNKLYALQEQKLWQAGKTKEYYSTLSEIIREYIELRFFVHALEQTTDEIMLHLRTSELNDELKARLRQLLMLSDLVKFAKEKPIASENETSIENALHFVRTTQVTQAAKETNDEPVA